MEHKNRQYVRVAAQYFRRVRPPARRGLFARLTKGTQYEVWQHDHPPVAISRSQLDRLLDARRFPADFWAAIQSADSAFDEGDQSWIEFGTGRRVATPPNAVE